MSILEVHTYTGATANIVSLEADGGTRRERGATIAAAVRRMRAAGLTVKKISTHYDEAYGFLARTTARYRVSAAPAAPTDAEALLAEIAAAHAEALEMNVTYRVQGHGERDYRLVSKENGIVTLKPVHGGMMWSFDAAEVYTV